MDSFSSRLKTCKAITGLSSVYILNQLKTKGIQFTTRQFSRWEAGATDTARIIKTDVVENIVDIFNDHGLPELSSDWLLYGKGMPPFLVDMSGALEEEKAFYIARAMGKNYKLITVNSDYAEPFASPGDYIITRSMPTEKLENKIALIITKDKKIFLGILKNSVEKITIKKWMNEVEIKKSAVEYSGRLTWVN